MHTRLTEFSNGTEIDGN